MTRPTNATVFRAMTLDDIGTIVAIEQESFTAPWTAEVFHNELMQNLFAKYMVMERDGAVLGYGGMWLIVDEAHVTNIAVREAYRGQGLGERLLREMMKTAHWLGARRMTLEVRVTNERAQRLYRKLGFSPSGLRPGYYSDNQEDALIMWADLVPDVWADPAATGTSEGEPYDR
ncbi:ribosomal protein S18-alanine N-acetyltransferase [Cohnella nanjingensis]|uniref:Ribosomal protein S18-alanine N-acetyltransferase n=1 Tax=Cohnella nanjingensis TaxID=1387779 RepID=A0A7X0VES2_9BACL|nr:ribosomal protein S18-alanine N-acetyltransferase [Cohnella nanjingensis]MBB6671051.1 ribosomal protein S18-alanine N-acetyltransferase [Cohnella nanjingensis]